MYKYTYVYEWIMLLMSVNMPGKYMCANDREHKY